MFQHQLQFIDGREDGNTNQPLAVGTFTRNVLVVPDGPAGDRAKWAGAMAGLSIGEVAPIGIYVVVTDDFKSGGAATLQVRLSCVKAPDAGMDADDTTGTPTKLLETDAIALANLTVGKEPLSAPIPFVHELTDMTHLRLECIVATAAFTAGRLEAILSWRQTGVPGQITPAGSQFTGNYWSNVGLRRSGTIGPPNQRRG